MKLYSKRQSDLEIRNAECVWIEMRIKHNPVLFGIFYKPPNSDISILNDKEALTDRAIDTGIKIIIITGDNNLDYLKPNTGTGKTNDDICNQYSMT